MRKIWNWYYGCASIRKKLVISYLVLVLFPILVLGIYSYCVSRENLLRQTRDTMVNNVDSIAYNLQSKIQRENDNIKYLSYNAKLREKLENSEKDKNALVKELNTSVEPTFWYFVSSDKNIKGIEIFSPYVEQDLGSFLKPLTPEMQAWYEENAENYKTQWVVREDRIYALRMLLDAATSSKPIGVMKLEVFPDELTNGIYQSDYLNNGVALVDSQGQIMKRRSLKNDTLEEKMELRIREGEKEGFYETRKAMMTVSEELSNGWRIYYYIDKEEISGQIIRILATTGCVMGICLGIAAVLMTVISRILSSRILQLKRCAEEVGQGNFQVKLEENYSDEIGIVAESFNKMCLKINHMMQEMYQLGMEKRKEELKALQAMMNPHFLYNCLSSIKWKAIRSGQDEIADITGLLAKFYRTALNGGKQITIVQNELENIKAYLEIQLKSHENSFSVEYSLAEEGRECRMPNFLLQPIVENAICHGVELCEEEMGKIKIEYLCEKDFLIFRVYNNGSRFDKERAEQILNTPGKGYGLYNIRERIRMYYDGECGITGHITENGMVCFTIKIRKQISEKLFI